jgi:hypothetical protein
VGSRQLPTIHDTAYPRLKSSISEKELNEIYTPIAKHISLIYGVHYQAMECEAYEGSGARHRHIARIREYFGGKKFDETAHSILSAAVRQAALLREDLVDIINIVIEEFVRRCYELPPFPALREEAQRARTATNREFFDAQIDVGQPRRSQYAGLALHFSKQSSMQIRRKTSEVVENADELSFGEGQVGGVGKQSDFQLK